jgi:Ca2+-binding EF-hand superfamily protein
MCIYIYEFAAQGKSKKSKKSRVAQVDENKDEKIDAAELIMMVRENDPTVTDEECEVRVKQLMKEFDVDG